MFACTKLLSIFPQMVLQGLHSMQVSTRNFWDRLENKWGPFHSIIWLKVRDFEGPKGRGEDFRHKIRRETFALFMQQKQQNTLQKELYAETESSFQEHNKQRKQRSEDRKKRNHKPQRFSFFSLLVFHSIFHFIISNIHDKEDEKPRRKKKGKAFEA